MKVSEIMTDEVEVITPDSAVREAAERMRDLDVGSLPVCDGRRLLGVITDRDITVRVTAEGQTGQSAKVEDVMTPEVVYVYEDQDVKEASDLMAKAQVRRLPVISREDEQLVGIVALGDIATEAKKKTAGAALEGISEPSTPKL